VVQEWILCEIPPQSPCSHPGFAGKYSQPTHKKGAQMDIDFHYYMTKALAQRAGFSSGDAQDIAYANQYLDDACEVIPVIINGLPKVVVEEWGVKNEIFNPVTTAHNDETIAGGILNKAQMNTYIPFHFIPEEAYGGNGDYNYRTRPNGTIARGLMNAAVKEILLAKSNREVLTRKLIKLGIASHSYIDTWAHQDFSGRFSTTENAVTDIKVLRDGKEISEEASVYNEKLNWVATPIGHARAGYRPDMAHLVWEYSTPSGPILRNNPEQFNEAAKNLYIFLVQAAAVNDKENFDAMTEGQREEYLKKKEEKALIDWNAGLGATVDKAVKYFPIGLDEKNYSTDKPAIYKTIFTDVQFDYDKKQWRDAVLTGDLKGFESSDSARILEVEYAIAHSANVQELKEKHSVPELSYRANNHFGLRWFYFHLEALAQREAVKSRIKPFPLMANNVVGLNLGDIVGKNVPRKVEKYLDESTGKIKEVWDSYRKVFPKPKEISGKHRWIQIEIENRTQLDIIWTKNSHFSSGRFWDGQFPKTILAGQRIAVGASDCDDSIGTGVSGATLFKIRLGDREFEPFTIAFSHPQESGAGSVTKGGVGYAGKTLGKGASLAGSVIKGLGATLGFGAAERAGEGLSHAGNQLDRAGDQLTEVARKCWATFCSETDKAWNALDEGSKQDIKLVELPDRTKVRLTLESTPGEKAKVIISQQVV